MPIVTISREFGSGANEFGQALAKYLDYTYIDRKEILRNMKTLGKSWEKAGEEFDEQYPNVWERYDWSFRGYVSLSQSIILNYGLKDRVVLIGRGGNFLFKGIPYALRVRLTKPKQARIERIVKEENMTQETARWFVEKVDKEMARTVQLIYGKNWNDPAEYDLHFDLGVSSEEEVMQQIKAALVEKAKLRTAEAHQVLRSRALAVKIKSAIDTNPSLLVPTLDVVPAPEGIVLRGIIHNAQEQKQIEEIAKKLAKDAPLKFDLVFRGLKRR
jgi:cytidylate kinase